MYNKKNYIVPCCNTSVHDRCPPHIYTGHTTHKNTLSRSFDHFNSRHLRLHGEGEGRRSRPAGRHPCRNSTVSEVPAHKFTLGIRISSAVHVHPRSPAPHRNASKSYRFFLARSLRRTVSENRPVPLYVLGARQPPHYCIAIHDKNTAHRTGHYALASTSFGTAAATSWSPRLSSSSSSGRSSGRSLWWVSTRQREDTDREGSGQREKVGCILTLFAHFANRSKWHTAGVFKYRIRTECFVWMCVWVWTSRPRPFT